MPLKVFTCTDHDYAWPVGCASIIIAENEELARRQLEVELDKLNLNYKRRDFTLIEHSLDQPSVEVLVTGEY